VFGTFGVICDDGEAATHGFEHDASKRVEPGREQQKVCRRIQTGRVCRVDPAQVERLGQSGAELFPGGSVAGFEFVNGFHDTANAVATVIYTHSLEPHVAVVWSGFWNF